MRDYDNVKVMEVTESLENGGRMKTDGLFKVCSVRFCYPEALLEMGDINESTAQELMAPENFTMKDRCPFQLFDIAGAGDYTFAKDVPMEDIAAARDPEVMGTKMKMLIAVISRIPASTSRDARVSVFNAGSGRFIRATVQALETERDCLRASGVHDGDDGWIEYGPQPAAHDDDGKDGTAIDADTAIEGDALPLGEGKAEAQDVERHEGEGHHKRRRRNNEGKSGVEDVTADDVDLAMEGDALPPPRGRQGRGTGCGSR